MVNGQEDFQMSSGPTYTGRASENYGNWVSVKISKDDWCTYDGECNVDKVVNRQDLCLFCKYRKPLDIPKMIKKE
jgi:hypothetical protein